MRRILKTRSNRWIVVAGYFCVILGIGLAAGLVASILNPDAKLDAPFNTTGLRAHLAIGAFVATLVCPVLAGFRHWGDSNYLIASALAFGLLFGSVGFGLCMSLFSFFILYGTQRLCFLLSYFRS